MEITGVAVASIITSATLFLNVNMYGICMKKLSLPGRHAFSKLGKYARLALVCSLQHVANTWFIYLLVIMTAFINLLSLGSFVILYNLISIVLFLPKCLQEASSYIIGSYIGENRVSMARYYAVIINSFSIVISIFTVIVMLLYKESIIRFYS